MTMVLLPGVISRFSTIPDFWLMKTAGMPGLPCPDGLDIMMSASYLSSYTMAATAPATSALLTCVQAGVKQWIPRQWVGTEMCCNSAP